MIHAYCACHVLSKEKKYFVFLWYFWNDAILRSCQIFKLFIATTLFSIIFTYETI